MILISNTNIKVSEIKLFLHSMRKLGMMIVKQNMTNKTAKEILSTSPAMIVEKKDTIWETENDLHRQNSKRMQKNLEKVSKENLVPIPLLEED